MIALVVLRYSDDAERLAAARPAHHAYARELRAAGKLLAAGPFADGSGAAFVYRARSLDEVRTMVDRDPFALRGALVDIEIKAWTLIAADGAEPGWPAS